MAALRGIGMRRLAAAARLVAPAPARSFGAAAPRAASWLPGVTRVSGRSGTLATASAGIGAPQARSLGTSGGASLLRGVARPNAWGLGGARPLAPLAVAGMGVPQLRQYGVRTRLSTREDLISPDQCRRIVVKVGSAVVTREDECGLALGRVAGIVEQLSELQLQGRQMMLVTSGAVAFGKQMLAQQNMLARSVRQTLRPSGLLNIDPRACSAAGQGGLISLYQSMFQQYGITCAQVLVTKNDFLSRQTMIHLGETLNELMRTNVVPIINENDAIAPPGTINADLEGVLSVTDNDSLAANVSRHLNADLLMILSDVDGIYK